jgi:hypothetical protein
MRRAAQGLASPGLLRVFCIGVQMLMAAPMIRIAISVAAFEAIAASLPKGSSARQPEPLEAGRGLALWIDTDTEVAPRRERRDGEGYSETILRLCQQAEVIEVGPTDSQQPKAARKPVEVADRARKRSAARRLAKRRPK